MRIIRHKVKVLLVLCLHAPRTDISWRDWQRGYSSFARSCRSRTERGDGRLFAALCNFPTEWRHADAFPLSAAFLSPFRLPPFRLLPSFASHSVYTSSILLFTSGSFLLPSFLPSVPYFSALGSSSSILPAFHLLISRPFLPSFLLRVPLSFRSSSSSLRPPP